MIENLKTRYWAAQNKQHINKTIGFWGHMSFNKNYIHYCHHRIRRVIRTYNYRHTWKYGYTLINYNKGYYRWRRDVQKYYRNNK